MEERNYTVVSVEEIGPTNLVLSKVEKTNQIHIANETLTQIYQFSRYLQSLTSTHQLREYFAKELASLKELASKFEIEVRTLAATVSKKEKYIFAQHGGLYTFFSLIKYSFQRLQEKLLEIFREEGVFTQILLPPFLQTWILLLQPAKEFVTIKEITQDLNKLYPLFPYMNYFVEKYPHTFTEAEAHKYIDAEKLREIGRNLDPFWYKHHTHLRIIRDVFYVTFISLVAMKKNPTSGGAVKYVSTLSTALKASFSSQESFRMLLNIRSDIDISLLRTIWTFAENPWITRLRGFTFPYVSVSKEIQIETPAEDPDLKGISISARLISDKEVTSGPPRPVILHIHGGGFVAGSAAAQEDVLRVWAINTGATIVAIDYRLVPEHKFPIPPKECLFLYNWILKGNLGFKPSKIVVTGDSAGANLACGLMIQCIEGEIPVADALVLEYPSLNMDSHATPSRILFYNDPILCVPVAQLLAKHYLPPGTDIRHPLVSPGYVSDHVLKKFPPTFMGIAEFDILSDEGIAFADRLMDQGRHVDLKIYHNLPHGFLSFGNSDQKIAIQDASDFMNRFLH